tara:strand:+ start:881 stop:1087 length:207 start_codon:yes stop_codon:yes gene_type:complete
MTFTTSIQAIDPKDGELKKWQGQHIEAFNFAHAEWKLQNTGMGYCKVEGILKSIIDSEGNQVKFDNLN